MLTMHFCYVVTILTITSCIICIESISNTTITVVATISVYTLLITHCHTIFTLIHIYVFKALLNREN